MMSSLNSYVGLGFFGFQLHVLFMALIVFAVVAAWLWLYKHAPKNLFLKVVLWTLVVGLIGDFLTAPAGFNGWQNMIGNGWSGSDNTMMGRMIQVMMQDNDLRDRMFEAMEGVDLTK